MLTVSFILVIGALIAALVHAVTAKCPLWVSVILLCICVALQTLPVR